MKRRWIALVLALSCLAGLLTACGTQTPEQTQPVGIDYMAPDLTGVKITQYMSPNTDLDPEDTYLNKAVEEHLGVDLEILEVDGLSRMVYDMVQEWELPDLLWINGYSHDAWGVYGAEHEAFINILEYLDAMPNVKAYLNDPANAELVEKFTYAEGKMYAVPVGMSGSAAIYTYLYRQDIFEQNNLTWPTNQEEFVATLRKLKELYPESQPFVMRNMIKNVAAAQIYGHLWGAAHVYVSGDRLFTLGSDGKYYLGLVSPAYKEMLLFMQELMAEGLMHADSPKIGTNDWIQSFATDKSFITYDKVDRLPVINEAGQAVNENFMMVAGEPFNMGSYAKETDVVTTSFYGGLSSYAYMIGDVENLGQVLDYVDWLYSEDGHIMTNWGVEGETYVVNEDGTKSFVPEFIESQPTLAKSGLTVSCMGGYSDFEAYKAFCEPYLTEAITIAERYAGKGPQQYALPYTDEELVIFSTYAQGLYSKLCDLWYSTLIGKTTIEKWESESARLCEIYCYDTLLKIHEDALARLLAE